MDKEFIAQAKERIDALILRLGDPDLFPDEKAELLAELRREVDGLKSAEDAERERAKKEKGRARARQKGEGGARTA